jgi:hypothetical protein
MQQNAPGCVPGALLRAMVRHAYAPAMTTSVHSCRCVQLQIASVPMVPLYSSTESPSPRPWQSGQWS